MPSPRRPTGTWRSAKASRFTEDSCESKMLHRLQKILSAAGVASRRAAEVLIVQGRVAVNGRVVRELGTRADPERDEIRVDGRRVKVAQAHRYILLHKPQGYVTTRSDQYGRRTVMDLLGCEAAGLYPVGRLDYDSAGLLLLTNDGDLAAHLTHPRYEVPKTYHAIVSGRPGDAALRRLSAGVRLDDGRTSPAEARVLKTYTARGRDQSLLEIVLREGRNRQVRRMCEAVGHPVLELRRVAIGPISDARLKPGMWRALTNAEVGRLRQAAEAADRAPRRRRAVSA
jgi:23S rRNA pseudouridine2605 synthase